MLRGRFLSRSLSIAGTVALGYVVGAAVIFFGLPSSDFLERAFIGGRSWNERKNVPQAADKQAASAPSANATAPAFKAGQVLISMRYLDAIAVLDVDTGSVVWAAGGPWREQHDPHFLDNGHLLIFDNRGGPNGSRAIEYDPVTQACPWWYPGDNDRPLYTSERGMSQRLPNGNTLLVDSEEGVLMEVSQNKEIVWSYSTGKFITTARRYRPDELPFLGGQRARP